MDLFILDEPIIMVNNLFVVREQKTSGIMEMLKPQDLLVTLKILGYENHERDRQAFQHRNLQGKAWINHNDHLVADSHYDIDTDELFIPDGDDIDQSDLNIIEAYLESSEPYSDQWTYRQLSSELFISLSEVSQSVKRAVASGLLFRRGSRGVRVNRSALVNFIRYGAGIAFFVEKGKPTRGIPTAYAAPVFDEMFAASSNLPPVWPCARGTVTGTALAPLYRSVTKAVMIDPWLYRQLALVDIYRSGTAREREEAAPLLDEMKGKS